MSWNIFGIKGIAQAISGYVYLSIAYFIGCTIAGYMQAWVVNSLGDEEVEPTLDPLAYIDPVGFIALCFFYIGWGRAIPINPDIAFRYRYPQAVLALMYGMPALTHFALSAVCYVLVRLVYGALIHVSAIEAVSVVSASQRVLLALLVFALYFNIVQTVFTGILALIKVIVTNTAYNRPEGWQVSDYILLMIVPIIAFFLFGDAMVASIFKLFTLIEHGVKGLAGR